MSSSEDESEHDVGHVAESEADAVEVFVDDANAENDEPSAVVVVAEGADDDEDDEYEEEYDEEDGADDGHDSGPDDEAAAKDPDTKKQKKRKDSDDGYRSKDSSPDSTSSEQSKKKNKSKKKKEIQPGHTAVKGLTIPFRNIKRTMKNDKDIATVQNEAAVMATCAAELFIKKLAQESHKFAKKHGRNTIRYEDVAEARANNSILDFLDILLP